MNDYPHDQIMRSLGNLEGKVDGINERLDKLNGSVARHEKSIQGLDILNAERKGAWKVTAVVAGAVSTFIYFLLNKII